MKPSSVDFITSAVRRNQWPQDNLPCIAFAGKSNVGKSSLINRIVNRKNIVRVSKTPGRTQMLNFFLINKAFYFVDLPGYGYAKVPQNLRKQWGPMIQDFLEHGANVRAVVQLMDIRHDPTRDDEALLDWLESLAIPTIPVLTKADKLSNNELAKNVRQYSKLTTLPVDAFTIFSSEDGRGVPDLWSRISAAIQTPRAAPTAEVEEEEAYDDEEVSED